VLNFRDDDGWSWWMKLMDAHPPPPWSFSSASSSLLIKRI
jgi:hypothetical protein